MLNKKNITGFEKYEIYDNGMVYSTQSNIFMKSVVNKGSGYAQVNFSNNGKVKGFQIHRLVAEHFIPNIYNKPQVNHIDGNKLNNSVENLEWVTDSEINFIVILLD